MSHLTDSLVVFPPIVVCYLANCASVAMFVLALDVLTSERVLSPPFIQFIHAYIQEPSVLLPYILYLQGFSSSTSGDGISKLAEGLRSLPDAFLPA